MKIKYIKQIFYTLIACFSFALGATTVTAAEKTQITIDSWRTDDIPIWKEILIPAFEKAHPNIEVLYEPTSATSYNASLNAKLKAGTAADIITCRPFDASLALFKKGYLASLNDLKGLANFSDVAKSAWVTDDGTQIFCIPMASVIHGFIYNKDIFKELGLKEPKTEAEFLALLEKIKKESRYTPLVMGTADQWEAATMGFQNIGPNYWKGEEGRKALIDGKAQLTDAPYVNTLEALAKWKPYLSRGFESQGYSDSQNLFMLGRGAIYPAGSWDIAFFTEKADFELGAFPPPLPEGADMCYISDHTDIAMGMNAATKHKKAVETFLDWVATPEFASLYSNALPGFFSLSNHKVTLKNKIANEFLGWREVCQSTIRNSYQILSRGTPNLENELWAKSVGVIKGTTTPKEATKQLQDGLSKWYPPHQK